VKTVVYIDVLVVLNALVNYLLLLGAGTLARRPLRRARLLLGAGAGGVASLLILAPPVPAPVSVLIKACLSAGVVWLAFGWGGWRVFARGAAAFFAVSFAFAGLMLGLWLALRPPGMVYQNGAVYFELNPLVLIASTVLCHLLLRLLARLLRKNAPDNRRYTVTLKAFGGQAAGAALLDTGNTLRDGFSGAPVMIVAHGLVKALLPKELRDFFEKPVDSLQGLPAAFLSRVRLVPYSSVGGAGLLPAFWAELVEVEDEKGVVRRLGKVLAAVTKEPLSNGDYQILLNGLMLE
jgi:stage II sporulation protein GA (sporulation sigma-E factor processing peptidase)